MESTLRDCLECITSTKWNSSFSASPRIREELQKNTEDMLKELRIPHRVVVSCTGDIGSVAAKKYDTEILMADGNYREVGSNSNCTDYQARRLNIKYRKADG